MDVLADIMTHDPAAAARSYFRPQHSKAAVLANDGVTSFLLQQAEVISPSVPAAFGLLIVPTHNQICNTFEF